jgi:hypothetical protein
MAYKRKLLILSVLTCSLALAYILTIVFGPERNMSRTSAYTWLDPGVKDMIDGIDITGRTESVKLVRRNGTWMVSYERDEYPAKQLRVEDFLGILTTRGMYPVRSDSASSHERLGLAEGAARITIRGGAGLPLLDLLVGNVDNTGREVYLRRADRNEVRSGEDRLSAYTASARTSWYDLALINATNAENIQRLSVYPPEGGARVFTRNGAAWIIDGLSVTKPDMTRVENYVRGILTLEADDFYGMGGASEIGGSRLTAELDNGMVYTIRFGPPDESGRVRAAVSGSPYVYTLSGWASERVFRDADFFEER